MTDRGYGARAPSPAVAPGRRSDAGARLVLVELCLPLARVGVRGVGEERVRVDGRASSTPPWPAAPGSSTVAGTSSGDGFPRSSVMVAPRLRAAALPRGRRVPAVAADDAVTRSAGCYAFVIAQCGPRRVPAL